MRVWHDEPRDVSQPGKIASSAAQQACPEFDVRRHDILLIEDDEDAREALASLLEDHGYSVRSAEHGRAALSQADQQAPDLVITDLEMPGLSGFDVLAQMRTRPTLADVPVIVLSAHHDLDKRVAGLDLGADDFLGKPVHVHELLARIRR